MWIASKPWRVRLYPKGWGDASGTHLSVYLETKVDWTKAQELVFSITVLGKDNENKFTAGGTKTFWAKGDIGGWQKFMPLAGLDDPAGTHNSLRLQVQAILATNKFGDIDNLSKAEARWVLTVKSLPRFIISEEFSLAGLLWRIHLYPEGCGDASGTHLSVFLESRTNVSLFSSEGVLVTYRISVNKGEDGNEFSKLGDYLVRTEGEILGWAKLMPLTEPRSPNGGWLASPNRWMGFATRESISIRVHVSKGGGS